MQSVALCRMYLCVRVRKVILGIRLLRVDRYQLNQSPKQRLPTRAIPHPAAPTPSVARSTARPSAPVCPPTKAHRPTVVPSVRSTPSVPQVRPALINDALIRAPTCAATTPNVRLSIIRLCAHVCLASLEIRSHNVRSSKLHPPRLKPRPVTPVSPPRVALMPGVGFRMSTQCASACPITMAMLMKVVAPSVSSIPTVH
uniref:Uncharacterized protein n=1 Tax=Cacopsylla melanoneura TaxID=428564 RepID=A0A8D8Y0U2_9HEMI